MCIEPPVFSESPKAKSTPPPRPEVVEPPCTIILPALSDAELPLEMLTDPDLNVASPDAILTWPLCAPLEDDNVTDPPIPVKLEPDCKIKFPPVLDAESPAFTSTSAPSPLEDGPATIDTEPAIPVDDDPVFKVRSPEVPTAALPLVSVIDPLDSDAVVSRVMLPPWPVALIPPFTLTSPPFGEPNPASIVTWPPSFKDDEPAVN